MFKSFKVVYTNALRTCDKKARVRRPSHPNTIYTFHHHKSTHLVENKTQHKYAPNTRATTRLETSARLYNSLLFLVPFARDTKSAKFDRLNTNTFNRYLVYLGGSVNTQRSAWLEVMTVPSSQAASPA